MRLRQPVPFEQLPNNACTPGNYLHWNRVDGVLIVRAGESGCVQDRAPKSKQENEVCLRPNARTHLTHTDPDRTARRAVETRMIKRLRKLHAVGKLILCNPVDR